MSHCRNSNSLIYSSTLSPPGRPPTLARHPGSYSPPASHPNHHPLAPHPPPASRPTHHHKLRNPILHNTQPPNSFLNSPTPITATSTAYLLNNNSQPPQSLGVVEIMEDKTRSYWDFTTGTTPLYRRCSADACSTTAAAMPVSSSICMVLKSSAFLSKRLTVLIEMIVAEIKVRQSSSIVVLVVLLVVAVAVVVVTEVVLIVVRVVI